jgi:hypothetical protein
VEVFQDQGEWCFSRSAPQETRDRMEHQGCPLWTLVAVAHGGCAERFAQLGRDGHEILL